MEKQLSIKERIRRIKEAINDMELENQGYELAKSSIQYSPAILADYKKQLAALEHEFKCLTEKRRIAKAKNRQRRSAGPQLQGQEILVSA